MKYEVICDFDGTISIADTTDALLDRFADPAWHTLEESWQRGEIGSAVCMQKQIDLLSVSKRQLDLWLKEVAIDRDFGAFVKFCRQQNIPISIASDGIDYVIDRVLSHHGIHNLQITANRLQFIGDKAYKLTPHRADTVACSSDAGVCKCALLNADRQLTIYVGDGRSDFCVSSKVDLVLAKSGSALAAYCVDRKLPHLTFKNFKEALNVLVKVNAGLELDQVRHLGIA